MAPKDNIWLKNTIFYFFKWLQVVYVNMPFIGNVWNLSVLPEVKWRLQLEKEDGLIEGIAFYALIRFMQGQKHSRFLYSSKWLISADKKWRDLGFLWRAGVMESLFSFVNRADEGQSFLGTFLGILNLYIYIFGVNLSWTFWLIGAQMIAESESSRSFSSNVINFRE